MKSKTQKAIQGFMYTDTEWCPMVRKTVKGYELVCFRMRRGRKEYGHVLGTFRYEKNAAKAAVAAVEARDRMLAAAYP